MKVFKLKSKFSLHEGGYLASAQLSYETWGELNEAKDNAILVCHALSGTQLLTGESSEIGGEDQELWVEELHEGWWNGLVGPGKAIDTDKYFVICANYLGGCYGSTGPRSTNPETNQPYGGDFPQIRIIDQVHAFHDLIEFLDIDQLEAVIGPSVGGLIALSYATAYAKNVRKVSLFCSGFKTTALTRLILFEQIMAIENDPHFNSGHYHTNQELPVYGLALARMISHKTFVHLDALERRASQKIVTDEKRLAWYPLQDNIQSYMLHQGKKFVKRFDANTYLRIIDMWSNYDPVKESDFSSPTELFAASKAAGHKYIIFSIDSDFCFFPEEQAEVVKHLENEEIDVTHITVHSDKGHDSFLLEPRLYEPHLKYLLED